MKPREDVDLNDPSAWEAWAVDQHHLVTPKEWADIDNGLPYQSSKAKARALQLRRNHLAGEAMMRLYR